MSSSSISDFLRSSPSLSHFEQFKQLERSVLTVSERVKEGEPINHDDLTDIETSLEGFDRLRDETSDDQDWETASEVLFATLSNLNEIVGTLHRGVETLRQENADLKERLKRLEDRVKHLESTQTDKLKLVLGQVAFDIDQSIPKLILNPVIGADHHVANIKDMQLALQGKEDFEDVFNSTDERRDCQQKWEELKTEIGWCSSFLRYMKSLKKNRLYIAHPTLSEDTIQAAMDHIQPSDKETFKKLLAIHKKIHQHLE